MAIKKFFLLSTYYILFSLPSFAKAATFEWRIIDDWPKESPQFKTAVSNIVKNAKILSGGQLLISPITPNDSSTVDIFDRVKAGDYEMGHSLSSNWGKKDINTLFFSTMPLGMTAPEQYAWYYHGGGLELMQKVYSNHGLIAFPGGNIGNQMGGWFRREIKTLKDIQGLKINTSGIAQDILKKLGANPIKTPQKSLYTALKNRQIDAIAWLDVSLGLKEKVYELTPFYYTGWDKPATELQFLINKSAFDKLPNNLKKILTLSIRLATYDTYIASYDFNINTIKKIKSEYPEVKIRTFPNEVIRLLSKETDLKIRELYNSGDVLTREIINSLDNYQSKARAWNRISDQAYLNNLGI